MKRLRVACLLVMVTGMDCRQSTDESSQSQGSKAPDGTIQFRSPKSFMAHYMDFLNHQEDELTRCLLGPKEDGSDGTEPASKDTKLDWGCALGFRNDCYGPPKNLQGLLEQQLLRNPKVFPEKIKNECLPALMKDRAIVKAWKPPAQFEPALASYAKALEDLTGALEGWLQTVPKILDRHAQRQQLMTLAAAWGATTDIQHGDPKAWQFDQLLHCAITRLDKYSDAEEIVQFLGRTCFPLSEPASESQTFLGHLRDTCIPGLQTPLAKKPATFSRTFKKFGQGHERISLAMAFCLSATRRGSESAGSVSLNRIWGELRRSNIEVRSVPVDN